MDEPRGTSQCCYHAQFTNPRLGLSAEHRTYSPTTSYRVREGSYACPYTTRIPEPLPT